jgi:hypothetical protein
MEAEEEPAARDVALLEDIEEEAALADVYGAAKGMFD